MSEFDGVYHPIFFNLVGSSLDHDDRLSRADYHQIQLAFAHFAVGGIDDKFVVQQADTHRSDRSVKGNVGNGQRGGCAIDRGNIGIVLGIGREHQGDDLGLIAESLRETAGESDGRSGGWPGFHARWGGLRA